jgi:UDP-GlcNAc:undecaprenyl-phosphate GlcNAc-1-phosphate transferase
MYANIFGPAYGLSLFGALMVSILILTNAKVVGEKLDIMDLPDNFRKRHTRVTPLVGGLAVMVPLVLWCGLMFASGPSLDQKLFMVIGLCGAGVTLVGYADDQSSTSPSSRLMSLFLFAIIAMIIDPGFVPTSLNWGSFTPTGIPQWFAFVFMALATAGFVNAVNMADGQNGVVLGMYTIWAGCLMIITGGATALTAQVLFELVLVTFLFNMTNRVFIGDSGSYGISFVFGLLAVRAHNSWNVSAETIAVWFGIPILDCLRLMVSRALQGQVPSDADRDHFHHRLQDRVGKNVGLAIYLGVVGVSSLVASLAPHLSLVCLVVLAGFYFSFAWLANADSKPMLAEGAGDSGEGDGAQPADNVSVLKFDTKDNAAGQR